MPAATVLEPEFDTIEIPRVMPGIKISSWRPAEDKQTLIGKFHVTIPGDMMILGCMVHRNGPNLWVMLPGAPALDIHGNVCRKNGKTVYQTIIRFESREAYRNFETLILEELQKLGYV